MICRCALPSNTPTIRSSACDTFGECIVASTRWPVSAAVSAVEIASKSRISPTTITSGSCRNTWISARLNERTSLSTSCCTTMARLFSCTNSMGSSMVTILQRRSLLIRSTR